MSKEKDIILILEGGAMSGVFCAGVICAFEKAKIYDRIESVYAVSIGAQIGAHFLSKKLIKTTELYTGEMLSKRHAFTKNISLKKIFQKVFNLIVFKKNMHLLDLEILKTIQRTKNKIDTRIIKNSQTKFYVKIFDTKNLTVKYLDGKKNTIEAINVSSYYAPYFYQKTRYSHYYDGELVPDNDFIRIIKENPNKKIIYVMNERRTAFYSFVELPIQIIHFLFKSRYFGLNFASYYLVHFFDKPNIKNIQKFSNTTVIYPNINIRKINTNKRTLKKVYNRGFKKGTTVLESLGVDTKKITI
jgi:predicted patatin/cPLA2 family phospholipase